MSYNSWPEALGGCIGIILIFAGLCIIMAFPFMWLWNWLMPVIFNLPEITVLQSMGLMFLSSMIFKTNINYKNKDIKDYSSYLDDIRNYLRKINDKLNK